MDTRGAVGSSPTPIYDAVTTDHGWSPADLRASFDLDAVIAASYGIGDVDSAAVRALRTP